MFVSDFRVWIFFLLFSQSLDTIISKNFRCVFRAHENHILAIIVPKILNFFYLDSLEEPKVLGISETIEMIPRN